MKKLIALIIIATLSLSGCAAFKTAACKPTVTEAIAYADQIAQASDSLAFLQTLVPTVPIVAIMTGLKLAISVLKQAQAGYCVEPAVIADAQTQVQSSTNIVSQMKRGVKLGLAGK